MQTAFIINTLLPVAVRALQAPTTTTHSSNSNSMQHDALPALVLVLAHDSRLAHDLYPVCHELAAAVVSGCSRVRVDSVADLALLLDSPGWASSVQQQLKKLSLGRCPSLGDDGTPACPVPGLHAWVTEEEGAGLARRAPKRRRMPKELEGPLGLASKCPQRGVLQIDGCWHRDSTLLPSSYWAPESIAALAAGAAQHWPLLEHLGVDYAMPCLDHNRRTKAKALLVAANTAPWLRLRHLHLPGNDLGFKAAKALAAAAPHWPQLQLLDLSDNRLPRRAGPDDRRQALAAAAVLASEGQQHAACQRSRGYRGSRAALAAAHRAGCGRLRTGA